MKDERLGYVGEITGIDSRPILDVLERDTSCQFQRSAVIGAGTFTTSTLTLQLPR